MSTKSWIVGVIPVAEASAAAHPAPDMLAAHAMRLSSQRDTA